MCNIEMHNDDPILHNSLLTGPVRAGAYFFQASPASVLHSVMTRSAKRRAAAELCMGTGTVYITLLDGPTAGIPGVSYTTADRGVSFFDSSSDLPHAEGPGPLRTRQPPEHTRPGTRLFGQFPSTPHRRRDFAGGPTAPGRRIRSSAVLVTQSLSGPTPWEAVPLRRWRHRRCDPQDDLGPVFCGGQPMVKLSALGRSSSTALLSLTLGFAQSITSALPSIPRNRAAFRERFTQRGEHLAEVILFVSRRQRRRESLP